MEKTITDSVFASSQQDKLIEPQGLSKSIEAKLKDLALQITVDAFDVKPAISKKITKKGFLVKAEEAIRDQYVSGQLGHNKHKVVKGATAQSANHLYQIFKDHTVVAAYMLALKAAGFGITKYSQLANICRGVKVKSEELGWFLGEGEAFTPLRKGEGLKIVKNKHIYNGLDNKDLREGGRAYNIINALPEEKREAAIKNLNCKKHIGITETYKEGGIDAFKKNGSLINEMGYSSHQRENSDIRLMSRCRTTNSYVANIDIDQAYPTFIFTDLYAEGHTNVQPYLNGHKDWYSCLGNQLTAINSREYSRSEVKQKFNTYVCNPKKWQHTDIEDAIGVILGNKAAHRLTEMTNTEYMLGLINRVAAVINGLQEYIRSRGYNSDGVIDGITCSAHATIAAAEYIKNNNLPVNFSIDRFVMVDGEYKKIKHKMTGPFLDNLIDLGQHSMSIKTLDNLIDNIFRNPSCNNTNIIYNNDNKHNIGGSEHSDISIGSHGSLITHSYKEKKDHIGKRQYVDAHIDPPPKIQTTKVPTKDLNILRRMLETVHS